MNEDSSRGGDNFQYGFRKGKEVERKRLDEIMSDAKGRNIEKALDVITEYGGIDGGHHKQWVLDQVVRQLTGIYYNKWVKELCDGEDGPNTYEWDIGIPP